MQKASENQLRRKFPGRRLLGELVPRRLGMLRSCGFVSDNQNAAHPHSTAEAATEVALRPGHEVEEHLFSDEVLARRGKRAEGSASWAQMKPHIKPSSLKGWQCSTQPQIMIVTRRILCTSSLSTNFQGLRLQSFGLSGSEFRVYVRAWCV